MHKYIIIYYISINLFSLEINKCLQGLDTNLTAGYACFQLSNVPQSI